MFRPVIDLCYPASKAGAAPDAAFHSSPVGMTMDDKGVTGKKGRGFIYNLTSSGQPFSIRVPAGKQEIPLRGKLENRSERQQLFTYFLESLWQYQKVTG